MAYYESADPAAVPARGNESMADVLSLLEQDGTLLGNQDEAGQLRGSEKKRPKASWMRSMAWMWDDSHRRFWVFQFAVWGVYFIIRSVLALAMGSAVTGLGVRIMVTLTGFLASYIMWQVLRSLSPGTIGRQISFLLALSILGAILLGMVEMFGQAWISGFKNTEKLFSEFGVLRGWALEVGWQSFQNVWVLSAWGGIYLGLDYSRRFQAERLRSAEANSLAHQAQLKMLRYQLNPHFLFNTLNALSALVLTKETNRAENMILRLSKFLRHTLDSDPLLRVPLSREMWALRLYLDIEKERFADRLTIETDISANARNCLVPSLILQPLIENALKYAVATSSEGGIIAIRATCEDGELQIVVQDSGPGIPEPIKDHLRRSGVGLRNTVGRLDRLFDGKAKLDIQNRPEGGLEVTICLPAECGDTDPDEDESDASPYRR